MTRRAISARERMAIFMASGGVCHICGDKIDGGKERWDVEHVIPLQMGGDDEGDNLQSAHTSCHKAKTAKDMGQIAKAKRMQQRSAGVRRQAKRKLPGSKDGPWRRKIDGTWERRT